MPEVNEPKLEEEIEGVLEELNLLPEMGELKQPISGNRLEQVEGMFETTSRIPTHSPRNFKEQRVLVDNGTTKRLYNRFGTSWEKTYDSVDWTDLTDGGATTLHSHAVAVGVVMGNSVRTSVAGTGSQSITGVGFQPTGVRITAAKIGDNVVSHGYSETEGSGYSLYYDDFTSNYAQDAIKIITLVDGGGNASYANLRTLDADGFSLTWTNVDFDAYFIWQAYR